MTHEEASAGPARRGGTRHEREHHTSRGKYGRKGWWEYLEINWEAGEKEPGVWSGWALWGRRQRPCLGQLDTYLLQSFACCFGTLSRPIINCNHHVNQNIANVIPKLKGRLAIPSLGRNVSR